MSSLTFNLLFKASSSNYQTSYLTEVGHTEKSSTAVSRYIRKVMKMVMDKQVMVLFSWTGSSRENRFKAVEKKWSYCQQHNIVKSIIGWCKCIWSVELVYLYQCLKWLFIVAAAQASFVHQSLVTPADVEAKMKRVLQNVSSERYSRKGKRDDTPAPFEREKTPATSDAVETEDDWAEKQYKGTGTVLADSSSLIFFYLNVPASCRYFFKSYFSIM